MEIDPTRIAGGAVYSLDGLITERCLGANKAVIEPTSWTPHRYKLGSSNLTLCGGFSGGDWGFMDDSGKVAKM